MKKYTIIIEETIVDEFEVVAETEEKALEFARKKYNDQKFILEPGEVQRKQMAVVSPHGEKLDWVEV